MLKKYFPRLVICFIATTQVVLAYAQQEAPVIIRANEVKATVSPTMWGIFFEDINFAADGGIYAEMVKNRSFEFAQPLMGWSQKKGFEGSGSILIINRGPAMSGNPRIARISVKNDNERYAMVNEGFRGMGVQQNNQYNFSILASMHEGLNQAIEAELVDENGNGIGKATITVAGNDWKKYTATITATATSAKASLVIWFTQKSVTDIDMVSLFPENTWKHRPGGLRADLVQLLADMKPGFIRFPGGCIVEGRDLNTRYQWKKTVGAVADRELIINRWNTEFADHAAPDYFQSFGMGFYEYFQLAEDIGASPLPILNCGMACQFNTAEVVAVDDLDPYIQDALDLIEFANGAVDTKWGKLRSSMGHPEPFHLKMMGIGNEQWGPQYVERYKELANAIHKQYPDMKFVSSVGPFAGGQMFDYLNPIMRNLKADILDEHYYMPPKFFLGGANRYDNYDRNGSKIFAGEYAAHIPGTKGMERNNWQSALAEAAFMTGLERNADVVEMCSYAPLFANAEAWQWAPDLIWFNSLQSYGTPNYFVQKLFSVNKGTDVVPALLNNEPITGKDSLYASAVLDKQAGEIVLKIVNASGKQVNKSVKLEGIKKTGGSAKLFVLQNDNLKTVNSFSSPVSVSPKENTMPVKGQKLDLSLPAYSFTVVRIKATF